MTEGKSQLQPSIELPAIDWELCVKSANYKEDVAQEVLTMILDQLPSDLKIIQTAYQNQDLAELLRYVHKVHGALCYTGLPALKAVVLELESCLKRQTSESAELNKLLEDLATEVQRVLSSPLP